MTFEAARRATELLLAVAVLQQAAEHLVGPRRDRRWFTAQAALAVLVLAGVAPVVVEGVLLLVSVATIRHFDGPYNGGSDRMRLLAIACLWASHLAPHHVWQRAALGYLAAQLTLSYAMSGWAKLSNPAWRSGEALRDVLAFSVYPVSEAWRVWSRTPRVLQTMSWLLLAFEVLFPLALLHPMTLRAALTTALAFHVANACVFGLNRFVWIWVAGYPCLLWFSQEALSGPR